MTMSPVTPVGYRNRAAFVLENSEVKVVITAEGGHVAEVLHKATGVNPLWTPPWPTMEPSAYSPEKHPEYGSSAEAYLLSGLLGHSICLDTYGAPSAEEAAAGMPIHGEAPVAVYEAAAATKDSITLSAVLPLAQIRFTRTVTLRGDVIEFEEDLENLAAVDRPIAWTQHVTMGPPFVEHGLTHFNASVKQSAVIDQDFGGVQKPGARFEWPLCPRTDGGLDDLRRYTLADRSAGFTTHLADAGRERAFFVAWHARRKLAFGYVWTRADFPWVCRWEENRTRTSPPWNGETVTCAFEFGVSPTIESRREMVTRGSMFGEPSFRWLPARGTLKTAYRAFARVCEKLPADASEFC